MAATRSAFTNRVPRRLALAPQATIKNVEDVEGNGVRITSRVVLVSRARAGPALVAEGCWASNA